MKGTTMQSTTISPSATNVFWALGGFGWGKGSTPQEAIDTYVETQLKNYRLKDLVFKTRKEFEDHLRANLDVWLAPAGATGFMDFGQGLHWQFGKEGDDSRPMELFVYPDQLVEDLSRPRKD